MTNDNFTYVKTEVPVKYLEIVRSIFGQLSDGLWENSRSTHIRGIWEFSHATEMPDSKFVWIAVNKKPSKTELYGRNIRFSYNTFYKKDANYIANELAKRLKTLAMTFIKFEKEDGVKFEDRRPFNLESTYVCDWVGYDKKDWSLGDMKTVYDYLKITH